MLEQSKRWIIDNCGTLNANQQLVLTNGYPKSGPARLFIYFDHPSKGEVKLDEWSCYVSRFDDFSQHLAWPEQCLTVFYSPTGRTERPCCATLPSPSPVTDWRVRDLGGRIDPLILNSARPKLQPRASKSVDPLLGLAYPLPKPTYPDELTAPPTTWRLPASMNALLGVLNENSGYSFTRFAHLSGVRFNAHTGDMLDDINDTVGETTIEAVTDAAGRLYALWLRTPEPVDWRRVTVSLRIRHVKQTGDCPTGYAQRHPLDLQANILPSPDGSSAFLVGEMAGIRTRLPRGEYTLKLTFDPQRADLSKLKPTSAVGSTPEMLTLKFIQPSGSDWPLPSTGLHIPAGLLEELVKIYHIDPKILEELLKPKPDPKLIERWRREPPIGPVVPDVELPDTQEVEALLNWVGRVAADVGPVLEDLASRIETLRGEEMQRGGAGAQRRAIGIKAAHTVLKTRP